MDKITIEVKGLAGSGKSAVAQAIAMLLQKLELDASLDLSVCLRELDEQQVVLDGMKERGTKFVVREVQTQAA